MNSSGHFSLELDNEKVVPFYLGDKILINLNWKRKI